MDWSVVCPLAEDVEVDVESIVFDCLDSDGLGIAHTDADHCYSSMDKAWLWRESNRRSLDGGGRGANIPKDKRMEEDVTVQLNTFFSQEE